MQLEMTTTASSPLPSRRESDNSTLSIRNHSATSGAPEEMFSPTSAAALTLTALSNLHNFGAAVPPPHDTNGTSLRPSTDSLTGTRLFNGSSSRKKDDGDNDDKEEGLHCHRHSVASALPDPPASIPEFTATGAGLPPTAGTTGTITWGLSQVHSLEATTTPLIGPPPPISRCNSLQSSASYQYQGRPLSRPASATNFVTPTPKKPKVGQSSSAVTTTEDTTSTQSGYYSRKNKSLGVLAANFIHKFQPYPSGYDIVVDDAANDLGVERRRIYDVVNILESIRLVSKEKKNTYKWIGMNDIDQVFGRLQAKAILEYPEDAKQHHLIQPEDDTSPVPSSSAGTRIHQTKSLARLSQEFLQVFLVGFQTLSLPEASDKIQGTTSVEELIALGGGRSNLARKMTSDPDGSPNTDEDKERKAAAARGLKTKIRRLYDIANVFISVGILKKVDASLAVTVTMGSRRPSFTWNYKLSAREIRELYLEELAKNSECLLSSNHKATATTLNKYDEKSSSTSIPNVRIKSEESAPADAAMDDEELSPSQYPSETVKSEPGLREIIVETKTDVAGIGDVTDLHFLSEREKMELDSSSF